MYVDFFYPEYIEWLTWKTRFFLDVPESFLPMYLVDDHTEIMPVLSNSVLIHVSLSSLSNL